MDSSLPPTRTTLTSCAFGAWKRNVTLPSEWTCGETSRFGASWGNAMTAANTAARANLRMTSIKSRRRRLLNRAFGLEDGRAMVHDAGDVRIGERDAPERMVAQHVARPRLPVRTEEESGLRGQVRMPPAIQNDSRNIALRIESRAGEHGRKLLADLPLV